MHSQRTMNSIFHEPETLQTIKPSVIQQPFVKPETTLCIYRLLPIGDINYRVILVVNYGE